MKNQTNRGKAKSRILVVTMGAVIAALYVVLTFVSNTLGLASGVVQVRISEALTVLPYFTPAAIPGLFVGCILSNVLFPAASGIVWADVIFGSLATLIGALGTYFLRKAPAWLAPIPPILANTLIIPFVLRFAYQFEDAMWFMFVTVFAGEVISCGVFGLILLYALKARHIFGSSGKKKE